MIKLVCSNEKCGYSYHVSQDELLENAQYHHVCLYCGAKNRVDNLAEIVQADLEAKAYEYLQKWFREQGAEKTIEILENNRNQVVYKIYKSILEKKGFKLK